MKNTYNIYTTIALSLLIMNLSCKDSSTDPNQRSINQLIPRAINNMWVYKIESFDSVGSITNSRIDTLIVTGDTLISNEKWYRINNSKIGFSTNRSDGFYTFYSYPVLEYKYPANAGDTIMVTNWEKCEVMSTNKIITVNSKTYTTYHYYDSYPSGVSNLSWDIFIAPNIGEIRIDTYKKNFQLQNYLSNRIDLISYKLN